MTPDFNRKAEKDKEGNNECGEGEAPLLRTQTDGKLGLGNGGLPFFDFARRDESGFLPLDGPFKPLMAFVTCLFLTALASFAHDNLSGGILK